MQWINEMFADMETDRAAESAKRTAKGTKVDRTEHLQKETPGAVEVWTALILAITNVNEFNRHKERVGQTAVSISQRHLQCEVYLPGMHSKRLVLHLDNNDLHVSVHSDFPKQPLAVTIELDANGQHGFWVLGETTKESVKLSAQQLSEYLLKPILSSAAINREL